MRLSLRPLMIAALVATSPAALLAQSSGTEDAAGQDAAPSDSAAQMPAGDGAAPAEPAADAATETTGETAMDTAPDEAPIDGARLIAADTLQGARIVTLDASYDESVWSEATPLDVILGDLTEIGEVEDVVLDPSGKMAGVTTDIGGFLGIGEKRVLLPLEDIRLARTGEDADDLTVVTRMTSEQLEEAEAFNFADDD